MITYSVAETRILYSSPTTQATYNYHMQAHAVPNGLLYTICNIYGISEHITCHKEQFLYLSAKVYLIVGFSKCNYLLAFLAGQFICKI